MSIESGLETARQNGQTPQSLGTAAARNSATTTKTADAGHLLALIARPRD